MRNKILFYVTGWRVQKRLVEVLNRYEKQEKVRKMTKKKYLSSLSRQLSEIKPNTKFILLCLEFNKSNKQSVCYINLFKKFNFSQS